MILLFGESGHRAAVDMGTAHCSVCGMDRRFDRVVESSYFSVFWLRLVKLKTMADYFECSSCGTAFGSDPHEGADHRVPSNFSLLLDTAAYILVGYGMQSRLDVGCEVLKKVASIDVSNSDLRPSVTKFEGGETDLKDEILKGNCNTNVLGKKQIIQTAFLLTHACCEIQHQDRVRVNLIGNALGLSLEYVNALVEELREMSYLGIRRLSEGQVV